MSLKTTSRILIVCLLGGAAQQAGAGPQWQITELPGLYGSDLNNAGQVVGSARFSAYGPLHAALYDGGSILDLGTLSADSRASSFATAINDYGRIVGHSETSLANDSIPYWSSSSFIYNAGTMRANPALGAAKSINNNGQIAGSSGPAGVVGAEAVIFDDRNGSVLSTHTDHTAYPSSVALSINNSGHAVGSINVLDPDSPGYVTGYPGDQRLRAALYDDSGLHELGTLGRAFSSAHYINDNGVVLGTVWNGDITRYIEVDDYANFAYFDGQLFELNPAMLGSDYEQSDAFAAAINNHGRIVGNLRGHAYYYDVKSGELVDLNDIVDLPDGIVLDAAIDINDKGQILAVGGGFSKTYLITPVPEPETCALLLGGLSMTAWVTRRRKQKKA